MGPDTTQQYDGDNPFTDLDDLNLIVLIRRGNLAALFRLLPRVIQNPDTFPRDGTEPTEPRDNPQEP